MAYLESGASLAAVMAAYEASSIYDVVEDASAGMALCREHIQACRILIGRTADETRQGGAALRNNAAKYERALKDATAWLTARDSSFSGVAGGGVTYADLSSLRD